MLRDDDLALLARPLYAFLTVAPKGDRWPSPRPVWFAVTGDGDLEMFSLPDSPKIDRLREHPRASVLVSAPTGENEHWVAVEGPVTLHDDGGVDLAARLTERYADPADPKYRELLDGYRADGVIRIVLRPERVNRFQG